MHNMNNRIKKIVLYTIYFIISIYLINTFYSYYSEPKNDAIILSDKEWRVVDNAKMKHSFSKSNLHFSWNKFVKHTIFVDKLTKAKEEGKSIPTDDLRIEGTDTQIPSISENGIITLTDAVYSDNEKSSGIFTTPNKDGYYHQTLQLIFTESFPIAVKRIISNHYIYIQTPSGQQIAYKSDILPLDSLLIDTTLMIGVFTLFFILLLKGLNVLWGLLIGTLYAVLLFSFDIISPIIPIIFTGLLAFSFYIGFKLKMWYITRKVLTYSTIILISILSCLFFALAFIFYNSQIQEFIEGEGLFSFFILAVFALAILVFTIYGIIYFYRIISLLSWGKKEIISEIAVHSSNMKTYHRSLPTYHMIVKINGQYSYKNINCSRTLHNKFHNKEELGCSILYFNNKGDAIIF